MSNQKRVLELDGVRGVAILMVLIYHGFAPAMVAAPFAWTGFPRLVESVASVGWMGVDLFFVLSGFLITGILLDAAGKPHYFKNFYARRALRILPLYYLILVLIAILSKGSGSYVLLGVFYLSNMAPLFGIPMIYVPLWSLSVEEHFYLLWPWLVSRLRLRGITILAVAVCVAEPIVRAIGYHYWAGGVGEAWRMSYYSWFRFDGLAAGALLASFVRSKYFSKLRLYFVGLTSIGVGGLIAAVTPLHTLIHFSLEFTVSTLFGVAVLSTVLSGEVHLLRTITRSKWLVKCGELSYCLYIIHWMAFYCVWDWIGGEYPAWFVSRIGPFGTLCVRALVVYVVSFIFAEISRRYFEGPILKLKRYFVSSGPTVRSITPMSAEPAETGIVGNG